MLAKISERIGKEIQLTVIPLHEWEAMREKDAFAKSILRNHILIKDAPL